MNQKIINHRERKLASRRSDSQKWDLALDAVKRCAKAAPFPASQRTNHAHARCQASPPSLSSLRTMQPPQSAAERFRTCYALRSFRQPTHLFLTAHGRPSTSFGSVRCARCYLSCRSCTIQTLPIRTAPLVGTRLLRRILKKKKTTLALGVSIDRPQTPSKLFINP